MLKYFYLASNPPSTAIDSPVINEASLTSDVDKNIPVDTSINNFKYALIIGNENYNK